MSDNHQKQQFGITTLTSQHKSIRKLKREFPISIHGNKIWKSSWILIDHFQKNPIPHTYKVLEIGCGWGLTAIYLNKTFSCDMTGLDGDANVEPYLLLHKDINQAKVSFIAQTFETLSKKQLSEYDMVIAADVCFWDELADVHFQLIRRAIKAGVKKIVYADPIRSPFENLAERCLNRFDAKVNHVDIDGINKASGALMIINN